MKGVALPASENGVVGGYVIRNVQHYVQYFAESEFRCQRFWQELR